MTDPAVTALAQPDVAAVVGGLGLDHRGVQLVEHPRLQHLLVVRHGAARPVGALLQALALGGGARARVEHRKILVVEQEEPPVGERPVEPQPGGGPVRAVLECAGIADVLSKSLGSANAIIIVHAAITALKGLERPEEVAARRGLPVDEVAPHALLRAAAESGAKS